MVLQKIENLFSLVPKHLWDIQKFNMYVWTPQIMDLSFFMSDPPHLIKQIKKQYTLSGYQYFHKKIVKLEDTEKCLGHFVSAFKRDNKRSIPLTKLNADCIYLNNWWVNLANSVRVGGQRNAIKWKWCNKIYTEIHSS